MSKYGRIIGEGSVGSISIKVPTLRWKIELTEGPHTFQSNRIKANSPLAPPIALSTLFHNQKNFNFLIQQSLQPSPTGVSEFLLYLSIRSFHLAFISFNYGRRCPGKSSPFFPQHTFPTDPAH